MRSGVLSTAFERIGGQWIWYGNAWAKGVPVSSEERELYLSFKPFAFRSAIKGRVATQPRRPYWRTVKRLLVASLTGRDPQSLA